MASDEELLRKAGAAGVAGGIRASLATFEERRFYDMLIRDGVTPVEALRLIERRRRELAGPSQSGR